MIFATNKFLIILVMSVLTLLKYTSCECRQSYVTICDKLSDLNNEGTEEWTELVIGSDLDNVPLEPLNFMKTHLVKFNKLTSLTIINRINEFITQYPYQCSYTNRLEFVTFYGNYIQKLTSYTFPVLKYKKLSLVNNNIQTIEEDTFFAHTIETLDLSHNKIEVIAASALSSIGENKILILKHNILYHIEDNGFPAMVEVLNLDHNNLRHIQQNVLSNLKNLKELTASHNKFSTLPDIQTLTKIKILDFSFNNIATITNNTFDPLKEMELLNLGHNNIKNGHFLNSVLLEKKPFKMQIALTFNHLSYLDASIQNFGNHTMFLFGNPWDCVEWDRISQIMSKNQNECDSKFFNSGKTPYCLNFRDNHYLWEKDKEVDINRFLKMIKENQRLVDCKLAPLKWNILYAVGVGCVA